MLRRPPDPPRGLDGLPVADPVEERVARAVMVVATAWFTLAAAWELFGPVLAGHTAAAASVGIIADNMLRWHIPGPVWEYTRTRPTPSMYYCHHPWGIFWTTAAVMKFLGRYDFICRLPAVLMSAATPPLLYTLGRAIWRPAAGAAAACAFTVLPITLAFANFNAFEVPVIAWSLLGLVGFVRLTQTGKRRHFVLALVGSTLALHADWAAMMLAGAMLGFGLFRAYVVPSVFGKVRELRSYATWWSLYATIAVLTLGLYLVLFKEADKLGELFSSYDQRSSGNALPLAKVLESRRYWIELCFTPVAIALGKVAAGVSVVRLVVLRREHEAIPLAVLAMSVLQYVVFKQGADIHIFWPHYFGAYFALGMGALVATVAPAMGWVVGRLRRLDRTTASRSGAIASLGCALFPLIAIARDGIPALRYARETGGRFNEKGLLIDTDGAKTVFLNFVARGLPRTALVDLHDGMRATWAQVWALRGRLLRVSQPLPTRGRSTGAALYLADARFLLGDHQAELARQFHVVSVGPFWKLTPDEPAAPIDAFSFAEREPSWWEWYFVSGTEPHREILFDPYRTWELRTHFAQPAQVPLVPPATLDQRRIAHNIAVATGDAAKAADLFAQIARELRPVRASFDDGTSIVGTTYREGSQSLLTVFLQAGGPISGDVQFTVRSKVVARPWGSLTTMDPTDREVGFPLEIPPQRWRRGFLYSDPVAIRKRPGTEVFRASFWARGTGRLPQRVGAGGAAVEVLSLR